MNPLNNIVSLKSYFCPEIVLIVGTIVLLFIAMQNRSAWRERAASWVAKLSLILALALTIWDGCHHKIWSDPKATVALFEGMIAYDAFGLFFKVLVYAAALVTVIFTAASRELQSSPRTEFNAFLLSLALGLGMMAVANDLLMMYLAIETASILSYIVAAYLGDSARSEEAGMKYVLYGGMASGIMIFGMSLLYGLTGTLNLIEMRQFFEANSTDRVVLFVTFIFILTGLGYKMAIAPFHMWSPDVYEGAPLPVTAFLSVASKAAGFALTVRFFLVGFTTVQNGAWLALKALDWQLLIAILAALTMTIGNLVALQQTNIKRFLAYSSVAQAGYILMGVAVQSTLGVQGILVSFSIYFLMNLGAFLVALLVANQYGTEEMADYKGLARRGGAGFFVAFCLSIFLFSLAGLPPFAGFIGKWYLFSAVMQSGMLWLAIIGVINSVISLAYYARLAKFMLVDSGESVAAVTHPSALHFAMLGGFAALTVFFGLNFSALADWARVSATLLR